MRCDLELSRAETRCWGHIKAFLVKDGGDPHVRTAHDLLGLHALSKVADRRRP